MALTLGVPVECSTWYVPRLNKCHTLVRKKLCLLCRMGRQCVRSAVKLLSIYARSGLLAPSIRHINWSCAPALFLWYDPLFQLGSTKSILNFWTWRFNEWWTQICLYYMLACAHLNYAQIHFIVILQIVIYTPSSCSVCTHTVTCTLT